MPDAHTLNRISGPAQRLSSFGTTIFAEITARANEHGAVNLGQGMPDTDGPDFIKDAAARAMRERPNQYAPMPGVPELRHAIAERWMEDTAQALDPDTEITVTCGATEAISACALGLLNPGDEAVLFEPYYDAYPAALAMAGARPICVPLESTGGGFGFDAERLRASITDRTRVIVLNTPHNPSGKVFSEAELNAIATVAIEHGLVVISDEVYDRLVYDASHLRIAAIEGMRDRTVTIGSFGKSYSMTGWKIGWTIAPTALSRGIRSAHQFLTFAIATPLQHAAAVALREGRQHEASQREMYRTRRDLLAGALRDTGFEFDTPASGYFILADHRPVSAPLGIDDDVSLCHHLIEHAGIASIPPTSFYQHPEHGRHLLRFAFCKSEGVLREAGERLRRWKDQSS